MVRQYSWSEIEGFLIGELKKSKHIMTWGTIGSRDVTHDVDTIITKYPRSPTDKFYKEIHEILDKLNNFLVKKYGANLIRFVMFEKEFLKLSNYNESNDLAFHIMIYSSMGQIKKDWNRSLFPGTKVEDILLNRYSCLKGKSTDLLNEEFNKETYADALFFYLHLYDRVRCNYDEKYLVSVMNYYFDYMFKKLLKMKTPIAKNEKDVRKIFYKLCKIADKMNVSRVVK